VGRADDKDTAASSAADHAPGRFQCQQEGHTAPHDVERLGLDLEAAIPDKILEMRSNIIVASFGLSVHGHGCRDIGVENYEVEARGVESGSQDGLYPGVRGQVLNRLFRVQTGSTSNPRESFDDLGLEPELRPQVGVLDGSSRVPDGSRDHRDARPVGFKKRPDGKTGHCLPPLLKAERQFPLQAPHHY
jgi:hypothetical protein